MWASSGLPASYYFPLKVTSQRPISLDIWWCNNGHVHIPRKLRLPSQRLLLSSPESTPTFIVSKMHRQVASTSPALLFSAFPGRRGGEGSDRPHLVCSRLSFCGAFLVFWKNYLPVSPTGRPYFQFLSLGEFLY